MHLKDIYPRVDTVDRMKVFCASKIKLPLALSLTIYLFLLIIEKELDSIKLSTLGTEI